MRRRRRVEVIHTVEQTVVVSRPAQPGLAWCPRCMAETPAVSAEVGARLAGVGTDEIFSWVLMGRAHRVSRPDDQLLFCLRSLWK